MGVSSIPQTNGALILRTPCESRAEAEEVVKKLQSVYDYGYTITSVDEHSNHYHEPGQEVSMAHSIYLGVQGVPGFIAGVLKYLQPQYYKRVGLGPTGEPLPPKVKGRKGEGLEEKALLAQPTVENLAN